MKEIQNEQLLQEVDNEVAASCSGGFARLFDGPGFGGRSLTFSGSENDLRKWDFDNKTSSIIIGENEVWAFYKNINFRGNPFILGPGRFHIGGSFNNSISSLRRIR